jgi:hypothetical protein
MFFHVANFYINATKLKKENKIERILFVKIYIYIQLFTIKYIK